MPHIGGPVGAQVGQYLYMGLDTSEIRRRMTAVRQRTLALVEPLDDAGLARQVDPIMSPAIWDLAHIAAHEELWIVRRLADRESLHPEFEAIYDAVETPRADRGQIDLLQFDQCVTYLKAVRDTSLKILDSADLDPDGPPMTACGYVFEMVLEHEAQHSETLLQALKMMPLGAYVPAARRDLPRGARKPHARIEVPEGPFEMGAGEGGFVYDCERPRHTVNVDGFDIARYPVTVGEYLEFMDDGGYGRDEVWSPDGRAWRDEVGAEAPMYWMRAADGWEVRDFERIAAPRLDDPVCHVSWFEADAYARWAGGRLPSEAEWERAVHSDRDLRDQSNLDQLAFQTAAVGAYPESATGAGCEQMFGDVWEWTSSTFTGYPGFVAYPYKEYSEIFFDGPYKSLRGGSWATQPYAIRPSFRNWDLPQRRQIFSGLRLAWDPT